MIDETQVTDEPLVDQTPPEQQEEKIEDALYNTDQKQDEPVNDGDEKTEDSEDDELVAQSGEEDPQEETEEPAEGDEKEVEVKLELEEGSLVSSEMLGEIEAWAKDNNLSQEAATGILQNQDKLLKSWVESKMQENETVIEGWRDIVINDKVLGGENLKKTVANAKKTVERFATPEFTDMLRQTGYGDHPEVVRFFSRIGTLLNNDSLVDGGEFGGTRSAEEIFYGS